MENKLFLLDAYALIFRAYYAFISNPMSNSKGLPTSTVFGFTLALDEVLRKEDPSHIAVVFDPPGPTFRHERYPLYKANRDATPEDIKISVPYIKRMLEAYHIPVIEEAGFEADDVIGTLSKRAEKEGYTVYMMTPDKDYAQLVSEKIYMYKPGRGGASPETLGVEDVKEKFLVEHPWQVIDILALWGDSSDNIPGAPGIGEKTAKKLIGSYNSVDGIYENIEELKGKQKENLINSKDQVILSRELATIVLDVPVDTEIKEMKRRDPDLGALRDFFNEMEFKTLANRILAAYSKEEDTPVLVSSNTAGGATLFDMPAGGEVKEETNSSKKSIDIVKHDYVLVENEDEIQNLVKNLSSLEEFCFDTETTGLDPLDAELVGIAFSWEAHRGYYLPLGTERAEVLKSLEPFKDIFQDENIAKTGQNLKYDLHILKNYSIDVRGTLFDTMLAHFLLKPEQKHNLNALAEQYLDYAMVKIEELIGSRGKQQASFRSVEKMQAKEYACEDADITWQLTQIFREMLEKEGLEKLAMDVEMPLLKVLMHMEHHGVKLDVDALAIFAGELREELIKVEGEIHELAGNPFNISSPKQLGEVLFERLKIVDDPKKTRTKQYATGEEILLQLKDRHPIIEKVLEYRSLRKLLNTYVEALPLLVKAQSGKLHTSYNQALVSTGRLSSNNPNLQNIPIREERGREIRRAFIPSVENNIFLSADYSQIELRIMAHLSGDAAMIRAFVNNEDIHTATAARVFSVDPGEVSREMRGKAKTANFGIIYGISAFGLSQRMGIPRKEARALIDGYFESYPGVKAFMDRCISEAREKGYVETIYGRRRFLPDILSRNSVVRGNAERNAINSPIQGTAADIIKIAMIDIAREMEEKQLKSAMILQVHDELNFDVLPEELGVMKDIVKDRMEGAASLQVPLSVDMGTGASWLEAH